MWWVKLRKLRPLMTAVHLVHYSVVVELMGWDHVPYCKFPVRCEASYQDLRQWSVRIFPTVQDSISCQSSKLSHNVLLRCK